MKYRTIVADPPWGYEGFTPPWRSSVAPPYPLMTLGEIKALPVQELADRDCHLYLWTVLPMVEAAYECVREWGFKPSTLLTWCKRGPGLGGGWRGNTEHVIVARRGSAPFLSSFAGPGTWHVASRGGVHSQKPDLFMDLIETASPSPRLELFARRNRFGWGVRFEAPRDVDLSFLVPAILAPDTEGEER
jgi:N6-adenosine-specific RNA methylase IME4